jgi:predicted outer membrane repeat protein
MPGPLFSFAALAALIGCGKDTESGPSLAISAESLDFGEVAVDGEASLSFTLSNEGGGEIELLSVTLIEGETTTWALERGDESVLGAGASAEVIVTFSPLEEGALDGRIQVRSDDAANSNLYVTLAGVGTPSEADDDGDGFSPADGDCDDGDASVNPGAEEICDGADNDCDGAVPEDEADADYDGWRDCDGDCDDGDANVYPGAPEICDDKDSDCDGVSSDDVDQDGDELTICDGDCDDSAAEAYPGAEEVCDGLDNDCSGAVDDIDGDGDGHGPCDPAPDCDDRDAEAWPVVVGPEGSDDNPGTAAEPLASLDAALAALDATCRTVYLLPGEYEVSRSWVSGEVTIAGGGARDEVVLRPPEGARIFEVSGGTLRLQGLTLTGADVKGDGGAVQVVSAGLELDKVTFEGNRCSNDGGAIKVASGTLSLNRAEFLDNVADDDGGAIYASSSRLEDDGSSYRGNSAVRGGGVVAETTDLRMDGVTFRENTASDEGGGLAVLGVTGISLERSDFLLNYAANRGGGLVLVDVSDLDGVVSNNLVRDNEAGVEGGGAALYGTAAVLTVGNNTFFDNASPGEGAGLYVDADDASGLTVWSNIVAWSDGASGLYGTPGAGGDYAWNLGYATSNVDYDFAGEVAAGEDNNLVDNPAFTAYSADGDPDDDTLTLQPSSPAIDSGPLDEAWNDPDGSRNDRGATGGPGAP